MIREIDLGKGKTVYRWSIDGVCREYVGSV